MDVFDSEVLKTNVSLSLAKLAVCTFELHVLYQLFTIPLPTTYYPLLPPLTPYTTYYHVYYHYSHY